MHGLNSDGNPWQWKGFMNGSGMTDANVMTRVERDMNTDVISTPKIVSSNDWSNLNDNTGLLADSLEIKANALMWRIDMQDSMGCSKVPYDDGTCKPSPLWSATSLERQGVMFYDAIESIKTSTDRTDFVFIGHSMGGLTIKSYINQFPDHHGGLGYFTIGTPHRGSIMNHLCGLLITDYLANELVNEIVGSFDPLFKQNDFCVLSKRDAMQDMKISSLTLLNLKNAHKTVPDKMAFGTLAHGGVVRSLLDIAGIPISNLFLPLFPDFLLFTENFYGDQLFSRKASSNKFCTSRQTLNVLPSPIFSPNLPRSRMMR